MSTIYELTDIERATMKALIEMGLVVRRGDVAEIIERCANTAEVEWLMFINTKEAHERNSPEPFRPKDFCFDYGRVMLSRQIAELIRAIKVKP